MFRLLTYQIELQKEKRLQAPSGASGTRELLLADILSLAERAEHDVQNPVAEAELR